MIVVSDTSPISNLFRVGHLHLLPAIYEQVIIPTVVFEELNGLEKIGFNISEIRNATWLVSRMPTNSKRISELLHSLDKGESCAIALAEELGTDLLIDEYEGRLIAQKSGVNTIGLLGVLLEAKNQNFIAEVKPILIELTEKIGFWVSEKLKTQILKLADEL